MLANFQPLVFPLPVHPSVEISTVAPPATVAKRTVQRNETGDFTGRYYNITAHFQGGGGQFDDILSIRVDLNADVFRHTQNLAFFVVATTVAPVALH